MLENQIIDSNKTIEAQEKSNSAIQNELENTKVILEKTDSEKDKISLFGMQLSKGLYNIMLWSIIGVLLLLVFTFIYKFKTSNSITKAAKKSSRDAAEGLAVVASNNSKACILEINSETDFVAKNNEFINFCSEVSKIALANNFNLETLSNAKINNILIKDALVNLIAKIGENIKIRRIAYLENSKGVIANYIHNLEVIV
mgnify:CR=1 FL=1